MAEPTTPSIKTPWHLWVVGLVSLLWNMMGVLDFTMTQTRNATYLKGVTAKQLEYFYGIPFWVVAAWGLAVFTGAGGSLLLLFRKRLAGPVFVASLIGMILTDLYNYVLSNGLEVMGGAGAVVFAAVIFVIGLLLWLYARAMCQRGVLR
jgi:hypothetical protein